MENLLQNEQTQDLLQQLEISEKNLNNNLNNKDLIRNFVVTADKVQRDLKKKYNELWLSPGERALMGQSDSTSEPVKVQQEEEIEM